MVTTHPRSTPDFDVIVSGAESSGPALAIQLARQGLKILLLDQTPFFNPALSNLVAFSNSTALLGELGVLDRVRAWGAPPVRMLSVESDGQTVGGAIPSFAEFEESFCLLRNDLHRILFEAAEHCPGVTVLKGHKLTELLCDETGSVCGIKCGAQGNSTRAIFARLVVGADGSTNYVGRMAGSQELFSEASRVSIFDACVRGFSDLPPAFRIVRKGRFRAGLFPTSGGLSVIQAFVPHDEDHWIAAFLAKPESAILDLFGHLAPDLSTRARSARVQSVRAIFRFKNTRNQGFGRGWALVGDALCFKDPGLGQSLHDSLESARTLALILARFSDWNTNWDEIRREYELKFYGRISARFEASLSSSRAEAPSLAQTRLFSRIAADAQATQKFLGFLNYRAPALNLR